MHKAAVTLGQLGVLLLWLLLLASCGDSDRPAACAGYDEGESAQGPGGIDSFDVTRQWQRAQQLSIATTREYAGDDYVEFAAGFTAEATVLRLERGEAVAGRPFEHVVTSRAQAEYALDALDDGDAVLVGKTKHGSAIVTVSSDKATGVGMCEQRPLGELNDFIDHLRDRDDDQTAPEVVQQLIAAPRGPLAVEYERWRNDQRG